LHRSLSAIILAAKAGIDPVGASYPKVSCRRKRHSYTPLRMSQMPEVAVSVIANGEHATGVGEPAVTVIAPALGNAIFNACGARVRALPITAEAVKAAMKA
jgi:CO/xanthine dehydrogenase Mo-binding subunit